MNTTHNKTPTYISRILTIGSAVCSFALFRMLLNSKSEWSDLFGWASETVCCIECMQDKKSTLIHNITSNKTYVLASRKHRYLLLFFLIFILLLSFTSCLFFINRNGDISMYVPHVYGDCCIGTTCFYEIFVQRLTCMLCDRFSISL